MKRLIAGIRAICTGLLVLLLVFSVFSLAVSLRGTDPPKLLGFTGAAVLSGSMDPYMKTGDFILVREQADYAVGDVVLFHDGGSLVTHRITRRTAAGFVTKGDANNAEDVSPVPPDVVEGRVVAVIPRLGAVLSFFKSPPGLLLLLAAGIFLYVYPSLIHALKRLRQSITSRFKTKETDHDET